MIFWLLPFFLHPHPLVSWIGPQVHNFGSVSANREVLHVFRYRNQTPDSIFLDNVRTSCGCTATEWDRKPLPPGQTDSLTVVFSESKRGPFKKSITVFFHQQRKPERLIIQGIVE